MQKVEAHSGMTVLATNLFGNFDAAFARHLSYVIRLQKPDVPTRLALWKSILPKGVKLAAEDIVRSIRYEYEKTGQMIDSVEFGRYSGYLF